MGNERIEAMNAQMEQETGCAKLFSAICALVWCCTMFVCGGIYIASMKNANDIDNGVCEDGLISVLDLCERMDYDNIYDTMFLRGPWDTDEVSNSELADL